MRKFTLAFLLISLSLIAQGQTAIHEFSKSYFRSDPFASTARAFLQHLLNDPDIADKKTEHRTDSTLFGFEGRYQKYNPFFFRPVKVEVSLSEIALATVNPEVRDTVMFYQLAAYAPATAEGQKDVIREVEKINRKFRKKFFKLTYDKLTSTPQSPTEGEAYNYFMPLYAVSAATAGWYKLENNEGYMVLLTMRLKIRSNMVDLPAPLYNPE
ncbi:MAG: hypothetical protein QM781_14725 [Chitinophagaceae bacterium]